VTIPRLFAIGFIFFCACVAWSTLGASVVSRTGESDERLAKEVARLWGGQHEQAAPAAVVERPRVVTEQVQEKDSRGQMVTRDVSRTVIDRVPIPLDSSRLKVDLALDQRRKGLLWYATYGVTFAGTYRLHNPDAQSRRWTCTWVSRPRKPSTTASPSGSTAGKCPTRVTFPREST